MSEKVVQITTPLGQENRVSRRLRYEFIEYMYDSKYKRDEKPIRARDLALVLNIMPKEAKQLLLDMGWYAPGSFDSCWHPPVNPTEFMEPDEDDYSLRVLCNSKLEK